MQISGWIMFYQDQRPTQGYRSGFCFGDVYCNDADDGI